MPKVIAYSPTERMGRKIRKAVSAQKVEKNLKSDQDVADLIGMKHSTYWSHKRNDFKTMKLDSFLKMSRALGFSQEEILEIFVGGAK